MVVGEGSSAEVIVEEVHSVVVMEEEVAVVEVETVEEGEGAVGAAKYATWKSSINVMGDDLKSILYP